MTVAYGLTVKTANLRPILNRRCVLQIIEQIVEFIRLYWFVQIRKEVVKVIVQTSGW